MFGGKREKELADETVRLKELLAAREKTLAQIGSEKDELEEQFAALAVANSQMEKELKLVTEQLRKMTELSEKNHEEAQELKQELLRAKDQTGKAEEAQDGFYNEVKGQNGRILEIVENNKHFTTPMKTITELPADYREGRERLDVQLEQMVDFSKNMGVLALNAAIEAGRMGEAAKKFVTTAENIHSFSNAYEAAAIDVIKQLGMLDGKIEQTEEQTRNLNRLLKDNNVSMGRLLKESNSSILEYENHKCSVGQLASKGAAEDLSGFLERSDTIAEMERHMEEGLLDMAELTKEQKECAGKMEQAFDKIRHAVKEGAFE